jgi:hypothetical protein
MITMPPPLAQWASQLDLTSLPSDLALAVRQYLGRMGQLRPEAAETLGYRLAAQVGHAIGAPLPPGVPVWAFLSAVLAERRTRDHARVLGTPAPAAFWPQPSYVHPVPVAAPRPSAVENPSAPENPFTPPS